MQYNLHNVPVWLLSLAYWTRAVIVSRAKACHHWDSFTLVMYHTFPSLLTLDEGHLMRYGGSQYCPRKAGVAGQQGPWKWIKVMCIFRLIVKDNIFLSCWCLIAVGRVISLVEVVQGAVWWIAEWYPRIATEAVITSSPVLRLKLHTRKLHISIFFWSRISTGFTKKATWTAWHTQYCRHELTVPLMV